MDSNHDLIFRSSRNSALRRWSQGSRFSFPDHALVRSRHDHRHSEARPQALNAESRCFDSPQFPGSIINAQPRWHGRGGRIPGTMHSPRGGFRSAPQPELITRKEERANPPLARSSFTNASVTECGARHRNLETAPRDFTGFLRRVVRRSRTQANHAELSPRSWRHRHARNQVR